MQEDIRIATARTTRGNDDALCLCERPAHRFCRSPLPQAITSRFSCGAGNPAWTFRTGKAGNLLSRTSCQGQDVRRSGGACLSRKRRHHRFTDPPSSARDIGLPYRISGNGCAWAVARGFQYGIHLIGVQGAACCDQVSRHIGQLHPRFSIAPRPVVYNRQPTGLFIARNAQQSVCIGDVRHLARCPEFIPRTNGIRSRPLRKNMTIHQLAKGRGNSSFRPDIVSLPARRSRDFYVRNAIGS